jgi:hypothetical protein
VDKRNEQNKKQEIIKQTQEMNREIRVYTTEFIYSFFFERGKILKGYPPPLSDKKGEGYAGLLPAKKPHICLKSEKHSQ